MTQSVISTVSPDIDFCFVGIDNTDNKFTSAASAYNYSIKSLCNGDIYVFCHQDIVFNEGVLEKIEEICSKEKNWLIGAAGVRNEENRNVISSIEDPYGHYKTLKGEAEEVFSLDECLIAGHKDIFTRLMFNDVLCDGWHFYTVEFCLRCHKNGIKVMVFDANIKHLSGGNVDDSFYKYIEKISDAYRNDFEWVATTIVRFSTKRLYCYKRRTRRIITKIKGVIRKILHIH